MDSLASAEFRKTYQRLTEPTLVKANGHVIGVFLPMTPLLGDGLAELYPPGVPAPPLSKPQQEEAIVDVFATHLSGTRDGERLMRDRKAAQDHRDAILRRINKGG